MSTRSAPLKKNWTETEQPHTDATRVFLLPIPIVHRDLLLLSLHSTVNTAEGLTFLFKFQVRLRHRIDKCVHKTSPFMSRPFVNIGWEKREDCLCFFHIFNVFLIQVMGTIKARNDSHCKGIFFIDFLEILSLP